MSGVSSVVRDVHELTDPRSLPNLELWLDARYPNGIGSAMPFDGDPLSTWTDLSGKGRHVQQSVASKRPRWRNQGKNLLPWPQAVPASNNLPGGSAPAFVFWSAATTPAPIVVEDSGTPSGIAAEFTMPSTAQQVQIHTNNIYPNYVTPGKTYTVTGSVKATAGLKALLWVRWFRADGTWFNSDFGPFTTSTGDWSHLRSTVVAPSDAVMVQVFIQVWNNGAAHVMRVSSYGLFSGVYDGNWVAPVSLPNSSPVVQFDGIDDIISGPMTEANPVTYYVVSRLAEAQPNTRKDLISLRGGAGSTGIIFGPSDKNAVRFGSKIADGTFPGQSVTNGIDNEKYSIYTGRASQSGIGGWVNGKSYPGFSPTAYALDSGAYTLAISATGFPFAGDLATVLIFSEEHSDNTRRRVERMLSRLYGVALA